MVIWNVTLLFFGFALWYETFSNCQDKYSYIVRVAGGWWCFFLRIPSYTVKLPVRSGSLSSPPLHCLMTSCLFLLAYLNSVSSNLCFPIPSHVVRSSVPKYSCCQRQKQLRIKDFFLPSAESFSPVEDVENFWMIFMQGECFFYCALACLEEETKTKIPNMPDPSDTSWELFCPISWAVCLIPVGRIGMEKKFVDRYVHVFIFALFLAPKPKNLAWNRYSPRRNPLEHRKAPTKFCRRTLTGL